MRYQQVSRQLDLAQTQQAEGSRRALTGRSINDPSDDPYGASQLVQIASRKARVLSQQDAVNKVRGDAELAEGVLDEAGELMARLHEIAVQGGSDENDAGARSTMADEVKGLKEQLLKMANTKGSNGYLFSGSKVTTQAFDATGAFQGDDVAHSVDVGSGSPTRVNASGAKAFTAAGGRDIFADIDALSTALQNNDGVGIRATLDNLASGQTQIQAERGQRGLLMGRLDTSEAALDHANTLLTTEDDRVGGLPATQAYSEYVNLNNALDRAISVSRQLLSLGTLNSQG
jgi:flagellar hook-associated protein 3 FlgL